MPSVVDHRTYAFVGDGCLQEGIGQEMISLAGHLRLGKLTLLWDDNRITDDGATDLSISEDVAARFRVADWHVVEVDGHDLEAVSAAIGAAKADPRPSLIACRTVIAKGIARLQGQRGGHSAKLLPEDAAAAREQLGWPSPPFEVPGRRAGRLARCRPPRPRRARGAGSAAWPHCRRPSAPSSSASSPASCPQAGATLLLDYKRGALDREPLPERHLHLRRDQRPAGRLHARAHGRLRRPRGADQPQAAPEAPSPRDDRSGAYVHCGVREHVMGAMANGMAAHGGVVPLAVTYLAFSDYERPAMRMAALMGLPVKFVFSHDSIGIGRNGPTHQPVEILASLRAMPNMLVLRPGRRGRGRRVLGDRARASQRAFDAGVRAPGAAARAAHAHERQPVAARRLRARRRPTAAPREVTLLATGSEVALALAARDALQAGGTPTAVVSMPSWELFDAQDAGLPRRACSARHGARVAVEAALRFGWDRWLGERGGFVGMTGFGASGPAEVLYEQFGITPEAIVAEARRLPRHPTRSTSVQPSQDRLPRPRHDRAADPRAAAVVRARADRARARRVPTRWSSAWPARRSPSPTRCRSPAAALERLPALQLVAVAATGTDCVDKAACAARGVAVSNIRGYAINTVPEHTFALILALRRNVVAYRESVLAGRWQQSGQFCFFDHPIRDLRGSRLGIIGEGVLGQRVAELARAFGMVPMFAAHKGSSGLGPLYTPWQEVIETSDVITLHSPLTPETRGMIAMPEFQAMKRRPLIVNTARGGLVDEAALVRALDAGLIAGAGFDVVDGEPPQARQPADARRRAPQRDPHAARGLGVRRSAAGTGRSVGGQHRELRRRPADESGRGAY